MAMTNGKRIDYDRVREAGDRLRAWRKLAKMKQEDAAKAVGCNHQSQWSEWERGTRCPNEGARKAIQALTGGLIGASDWISEEAVELRPTGTG